MTLDDLPSDIQDVAKQALEAMESGFCLRFDYDGLPRLVEVHAVGVSTAGRPCMRVYQVAGGSVHNEPEGWKMMTLAKIYDLTEIEIESLAPREGYQKGDLGMTYIINEI